MAAAVLVTAVWTSGAQADPAGTTARALVADWKDGDREMRRSRRSHSQRLRQRNVQGRDDRGTPLLSAADGAFTGNQAMSMLESFIADHPAPPHLAFRIRNIPRYAFGRTGERVARQGKVRHQG